jgi:hypothetical protein
MSANDNLVKTIEVKDDRGRVIGTKEVVAYAGLLSRAHEEGLKRLWTQILQYPNEANLLTAVFSATVETSRGTFTAHGDANPDNVDARIVPHIIRMAETRAKARALRDAVNIGVVAIEELAFNGNGEMGTRAVAQATEPKEQSGHVAPTPRPDTRTVVTTIPEQPQQATKPGAANAGNRTGGGSAPSKPRSSNANGSPRNGKNRNGDSPMSDAQRRYIFRLLAEAGVEGDAAHDWLKQRCEAETLKEVTKAHASSVIEQLLAEARVKEEAEVSFP